MNAYIWFAVGLVIGLIIGILFGRIRKKYDGAFIVDLTNPDKDVLTVELSCPIGELPNKKYVIFKVNSSSQTLPLA